MAQLDVQPKQRSPFWIWIVVLLVILGVLFMLWRGCNRSYQPQALRTTDSDSTVVDTGKAASVAITQPDWEAVDFELPKSTYDEITDTAVVVRGNDKYTIYGLGENILFAENQSTLQGSAEGRLHMISASLHKRFNNAAIGVYGHTDSTGTSSTNRILGAQRANAVKDWLINKGGFAEQMISVHSVGETRPIATNGTENGKQQNRSVEIVAFPRDTTKTQ